MRILLMADTPANPDSGAAGTEFQTVLAMRRLGHEVDAVWADGLPHRIRHGNLHYLAELPFAYRKRMIERLQSKAYDVVHVNQPHGYLAARALFGRGALPVFVHRSHGLEPRVRESLRPWLRRYASKRPVLRRIASGVMETLLEFNNLGITRYADGHIVSASLCGDFLHQRYGVPHDRIVVIPQAPPGIFQTAPATAIDARRLKRLLYVGQYAFIKGPMILAAAFEQVLAKHPEATLTWVCDKRHHEEAASLLSSQARERVSFLHWVPQVELLGIYDDHGVFLFPSFFEGFGKAFLEAMSRGLVVVASAEGGARDIIENGRNGMLAPVGDVAAMASACNDILDNQGLAMDIGSHARQTALRYTWDRVAQETVGFYQRLIERKKLT
ncbi:Spore coat protein SA [Rhodocyclaceae bacterium]|nr:Spore coat protein SA [Rhodocyclaceae bacterium]